MPELQVKLIDRLDYAASATSAYSPIDTPPSSPVVSVCIANRDCRLHLQRCLSSLLGQPQGVAFEIIVVDNASTDGAADLVANLFPAVHLVRNRTNVGFSRANNQAAEKARGEHLFFLNNDTLVPPGTLAELVEVQENYPHAWLIGPRLLGADGAVQRGPRRLPTLATFLHRTCLGRWSGLFHRHYQRYCREVVLEDRPRPVELLMGAAVWIRRDRFEALGGWDEDFFFGGEDLELSLRAARYGVVLHAPNVEITHLGRASTRLYIGQTSIHIAIGFVQYLRKKGISTPSILGYKLAITLDTPPQILLKVGQLGVRLLRGQWSKAGKCWNDLKGLCTFLIKGMLPFWRA